jgi:hypothetical protein
MTMSAEAVCRFVISISILAYLVALATLLLQHQLH